MTNLAVFASGTGTNFDAIADAIDNGELEAKIVLVVCDKLGAKVIEKAQKRGIEVFAFNPKDYENKAAYEAEIVSVCKEHGVEFIALAGYMRLFSDTLLAEYEGRCVNIHPALLPAFKGKNAIHQAIEYGVKVIGVTIHYVDSGMDSGKIIAQKAFEIEDGWDEEEIESRIHKIEHVLYKETLIKLLNHKENN